MTTKELSQIYFLKREIEANKKRLEYLQETARAPSTTKLFLGSSGAQYGFDNRVERIVTEIADLQKVIEERQIQCIREQTRLEKWINAIPDSLTRQIFAYRFMDCMGWAQTALRVGGGNTYDSVRQIAYRYLKKDKNKKEG